MAKDNPPTISNKSFKQTKFDIKSYIFESKRYRIRETPAVKGEIVRREREGLSSLLGGQISVRVSGIPNASRLLFEEREKIAYWQAAKQFKIKFPGDKFARHTTGFSKARKANESSEADIRKALEECAINALRQFGKQFSYENNAPSYVKDAHKRDFTIIIFLRLTARQTIFGE